MGTDWFFSRVRKKASPVNLVKKFSYERAVTLGILLSSYHLCFWPFAAIGGLSRSISAMRTLAEPG